MAAAQLAPRPDLTLTQQPQRAVQSPRPGRLLLLTHTLCPYAQRVAMTLLHRQCASDWVQIDLSSKPRWLASIAPAGLVPVLIDEAGTARTESLDLCAWLEARPSSGPSLTPGEAAGRARMRALLASAPSLVSAGLGMVAGSTARHWGLGRNPSDSQRARFQAACQELAANLDQGGGPFLAGSQPCLADMALLPFFSRFQLALELFQDAQLGSLGPGGAAVEAWLAAGAQLPAMQLAAPDRGLFAAALREHRSLDFFDYAPYTATQLAPHLAPYELPAAAE